MKNAGKNSSFLRDFKTAKNVNGRKYKRYSGWIEVGPALPKLKPITATAVALPVSAPLGLPRVEAMKLPKKKANGRPMKGRKVGLREGWKKKQIAGIL